MDDSLEILQHAQQHIYDTICKWKDEARKQIENYKSLDENIKNECENSFNNVFNILTQNIEKFEKKDLELRQSMIDILVDERNEIQYSNCGHGFIKEMKSWKKRR